MVITISLPPLRERPDDIHPLVEYFIAQACKNNGRHIESVNPDFYDALEKYPWPGNVRELRNVVESAVILAVSPELKAGDVRLSGGEQVLFPPDAERVQLTLAEAEKESILNSLKKYKGSRTLAARELGISTRTIQRKIKDYNLPF
jgi:DNA-binding NtrC family response regulator